MKPGYIEIKTLARRAIGKVKREYHHQMQHQMFCLDLERTHFIEAKYVEWGADTVDAWRTAKSNYAFSGAILERPDGTGVYSLWMSRTRRRRYKPLKAKVERSFGR